MTDYTPNYNFQLPDFDQRFWHDEMRRILKGFDSVLAKYVAVGNVKGVWSTNTTYNLGDVIVDEDVGNLYECAVNHVSANTGSFADDRLVRPSYWINASITNRYRGAWASGIEYRAGDFVVSGNKYAVATQLFTSGTTFASDAAAGWFETLIDLAAIPASVVPVPNVSTALNYVRQNSAGDGYEVVPIGTVVAQMALGSLAFLNQVTTANINSGAAANGHVIVANGSGGASWGASLPKITITQFSSTKNFTSNILLGLLVTPTNTDGNEITELAQTVTLRAAGNSVRVQANIMLAASTAQTHIVAIFRGSTIVKASNMYSGGAENVIVTIDALDSPGSVGPHNYTVRVACTAGVANHYVNRGSSATAYHNGNIASSLVLTEFA